MYQDDHLVLFVKFLSFECGKLNLYLPLRVLPLYLGVSFTPTSYVLCRDVNECKRLEKASSKFKKTEVLCHGKVPS